MSARFPGVDLAELALVEDVAAELGVSAVTLREWCRRGRFPSVKLPGTRRILIPRAWARAYVGGDTELVIEAKRDGGRVVRPAGSARSLGGR